MRSHRWVAPLAALSLILGAAQSVVAETVADACLELAPSVLSAEDWSVVAPAVAEAVAERTALFPAPQIDTQGTRLDIASGHAGLSSGTGSCLEEGAEWTSRFGRDFLQAGAELMLAQAPTTPGIDSEVTIEWYPDETRLRTTLVFAGPLDIPNGTCWIDDELAVNEGSVVASGEEGVKTSIFAEAACGRFFDHLPDGGAGEQAISLLPAVIESPAGGQLRFAAETVTVLEDALIVSGVVARD